MVPFGNIDREDVMARDMIRTRAVALNQRYGICRLPSLVAVARVQKE
jgi:hypothetical protein